MMNMRSARKIRYTALLKAGDQVIEKIVYTQVGFIVVYASGRTRIYTGPCKKLPKTIRRFLDEHTQRVERYGDQIYAIVWR